MLQKLGKVEKKIKLKGGWDICIDMYVYILLYTYVYNSIYIVLDILILNKQGGKLGGLQKKCVSIYYICPCWRDLQGFASIHIPFIAFGMFLFFETRPMSQIRNPTTTDKHRGDLWRWAQKPVRNGVKWAPLYGYKPLRVAHLVGKNLITNHIWGVYSWTPLAEAELREGA